MNWIYFWLILYLFRAKCNKYKLSYFSVFWMSSYRPGTTYWQNTYYTLIICWYLINICICLPKQASCWTYSSWYQCEPQFAIYGESHLSVANHNMFDHDNEFVPRNLLPYHVSRSATPSFVDLPGNHPTGMSEYLNDEPTLPLSARSESPYYNPSPSVNALPEFHMSNLLHRMRSFGSGQSSQSRWSSQSLNSDRLSSGSIRYNDRVTQELQMEVALLRSENQSLKSERENLSYVITLVYIFS